MSHAQDPFHRIDVRNSSQHVRLEHRGVDEEIPDIAWSREDPLFDASGVKGMISFYQERLDVFIDGRPVQRVRAPWF